MSPTPEEIQAAILAERERIARWHEKQAEVFEAAVERIKAEGGTVQPTGLTLADLHRAFAKAIREGAE